MDPVRQHLDTLMSEYLSNLEEIVNLDSGTLDADGVNAVASRMRAWLEAAGCDVTALPSAEYGASLIARLHGEGSRKVVLVGHMDTVYPAGTAAERPFRLEGEYAYGPGAADMKSGLLAGLYALRALQDTGHWEFGEVVFFLNPDEEMGSPSSAAAIDRECDGASAAFVLESGRADGSVVVGRKGVYDYTLTAYGRNAHAGVEPEKGRNAVLELAHKVVALSALNGLSDGTSVNAGVISGGTKANVVPDRAMCHVDVRVKTLEAAEQLDRELRRIVSEPVVPDTRIELRAGCHFPPMERNGRNIGLFETARRIAAPLGFELNGVETGGGSDANHISALGVPVLDGLGPVGDGAHSPGEKLLIPSVPERAALLAHLILETSR